MVPRFHLKAETVPPEAEGFRRVDLDDDAVAL
jgi:hypothetical protein